MTTSDEDRHDTRPRLTRDRIVATAVTLADRNGVAAVTMRAVAAELGVEAMSLYNHVTNRADLLDGMVDTVFAEIEIAPQSTDWRAAMGDRATSARAALRRHRWAVGLLDSRSHPGPATLRHHDAVLGILRTNGFSVAMAVHAVSLIDSYVYGFVLQELSLPFATPAEFDEVAARIGGELSAGTHPYLAEVISEQQRPAGFDTDAEFDRGLTLILDALAADES